jgi:hypothetical protein
MWDKIAFKLKGLRDWGWWGGLVIKMIHVGGIRNVYKSFLRTGSFCASFLITELSFSPRHTRPVPLSTESRKVRVNGKCVSSI